MHFLHKNELLGKVKTFSKHGKNLRNYIVKKKQKLLYQ